MAAESPIPEMLRAIWQRSLPLIRERIDQLDATAASATSGSMTDAQRELALSNAHKLAGSLGTFGYAEGSEIARAIELQLAARVDAEQLVKDVSRLRSVLQL